MYVCRNPKDAMVSFFKFHQTITTPEMGDAPFEDFVALAMDGEVEYGGYWEHLKSGWGRRGHPNLKFVWFEDLKRETAETIRDDYIATRQHVCPRVRADLIGCLTMIFKESLRDDITCSL